jgi:hypothetical protein
MPWTAAWKTRVNESVTAWQQQQVNACGACKPWGVAPRGGVLARQLWTSQRLCLGILDKEDAENLLSSLLRQLPLLLRLLLLLSLLLKY